MQADGLDVGLLRQSPGQLPDFAVGEVEAEDAASRPAPPPPDTGINVRLIGHCELLPSVGVLSAIFPLGEKSMLEIGCDH